MWSTYLRKVSDCHRTPRGLKTKEKLELLVSTVTFISYFTPDESHFAGRKLHFFLYSSLSILRRSLETFLRYVLFYLSIYFVISRFSFNHYDFHALGETRKLNLFYHLLGKMTKLIIVLPPSRR